MKLRRALHRCSHVPGGRWSLALAGWLLLAGSGCPERAPAPGGSATVCSSFGQRCEVSPGKLGTCVKRDDCTGDDCYVCQSQH